MSIIAVAANLMGVGLLLGVEALISWLGWVDPEISKDRYLRNRNLFRIGDAVALSVVSFAVGVILDRTGFPPMWYIFTAVLFAILLTAYSHWKVWLVQPQRDPAYPPGRVSFLGILHLPYFAGLVTWVLLGLWHITDLSILGFTLVGLLGSTVWIFTVLQDGRQNKEG